MADTTEGDTIQVQNLNLLAPALMSLIAGLVIHSFIIGINVTDWWKGRSLTPVDHIVNSLAISRMCAQCSITIYVLLAAITPGNLISLIIIHIKDGGYCFFASNNSLLTSLLSIVLCQEISNLHTRLFPCLSQFIVRNTLYFKVFSILLSLLTSLISMVITGVTEGETYNITMNDFAMNNTNINFTCSNSIETFFPLLFYYVSSVLLFTSLYHHTTRMKMSSNLSINLETYYSVMRFVSFTFIYITIYFIVNFAQITYYYFYCINLVWLYIVQGFLPSLHSSYLIYTSAKFRDQMSKVLHNVNDFQRKNTETQETIEVQM